MQQFLSKMKEAVELLIQARGVSPVQLTAHPNNVPPSPASAGQIVFIQDALQATEVGSNTRGGTYGGSGGLAFSDGTKWVNLKDGRGHHAAQVTLTSSTTLSANHAGRHVLLTTAGITITLPNAKQTFALNNQSTGNITLVFGIGSDYRTTMYPGDNVVLTGDGLGNWRTLSSGNGSAQSTTFAGLPASPYKSQRAFITDSNTVVFLAVAAAGGANNVPVVYNGTNWVVG